ncbi:MAG: protein kinase [Verrucomicrobiaceae bacterium]|nr:protein kinase [Verrucomicrobiaceae bacterium]
MGIVWRGRQRTLNREVAVKTLPGGEFASDEARARFRLEAQAIARLNHPHVVSVYEVGEVDGMPYLIMELVRGHTLDELTRGKGMPAAVAALCVRDAASALQHAHEQGVLHRDVKPANLLIDAAGRARLTDFGLAKLNDTAPGILTVQGTAAGSPAYMAPEQALHGHAEAAADIYGAGALLYTALTGRPPFQGGSVAAVIAQVTHSEPVPPRRLDTGIPRDLENICLRCLEKNPARRYTSAAALAEDLTAFLEGRSVKARPVVWWVHSWRWARRQPVQAAALVLCIVAPLIIAVTTLVSAQRIDLALRQAELSAADLHVREANRRVEELDPLAALPSLVAALQTEQADVSRRDMNRTRLATTLRACPNLRQLWQVGGSQYQGDPPLTFPNPIYFASFSPDGRYIAAANGWQVHLWDTESGQSHLADLSAAGNCLYVAYSRDGRRLITGDKQDCLTVFDVTADYKVLHSGLRHDLGGAHPASLIRPVLDASGSRLICSESGPRSTSIVRLVLLDEKDSSGHPCVHRLHSGTRVRSLALAPDSQTVAIGLQDGQIVFWDIKREIPQQIAAWTTGRDPVRFIEYRKDGKKIALIRDESIFEIWDVATQQHIGPSHPHSGFAYQVQFSEDGGLAISSAYGQLSSIALDTQTGVPSYVLRVPQGLRSVQQSADGKKLLTAGWDGTARLWETASGKPLGIISRHASYLSCALFSPDDKLVFSGGYDGLGRLWELRHRILPRKGPIPKSVPICATSPGGNQTPIQSTQMVLLKMISSYTTSS